MMYGKEVRKSEVGEIHVFSTFSHHGNNVTVHIRCQIPSDNLKDHIMLSIEGASMPRMRFYFLSLNRENSDAFLYCYYKSQTVSLGYYQTHESRSASTMTLLTYHLVGNSTSLFESLFTSYILITFIFMP